MPDLGGGQRGGGHAGLRRLPDGEGRRQDGSAPVSDTCASASSACRPLAIAPAGHCAMWCRRSVPSGRTGGGPSDFPWRQSSCGGLRSDYIAQGPVRQYANGASVFHGLTRCRRPRASRPIGWSHLLVVLHRLPGSRARDRGARDRMPALPQAGTIPRPTPWTAPCIRCSGCAPICARTTIRPGRRRVTARSQRCFSQRPDNGNCMATRRPRSTSGCNLHALSGDLQALGIP